MTDGTAQGWRPLRPWLAVVLITILALALRVAWLGSKSLWTDEADSFYFASHSFSDIFSRLCDPHPPGYYALLRVFLTWGRSEFWVRLPSAIAGTLAVPLLYALARELDAALGVPWFDRRTALLAPLLLALSPLHVWYSQEARMYALVTTLGLCAAIFALRFVRRRRGWDALGYVLVAVAALFVDQSSILPLLLANLLWGGLWLRNSQGRGRRWWELAIWGGLQGVAGITFWLWQSQALYSSFSYTRTFYPLVMVRSLLQQLGLPSVTLTDVQWMLAIGTMICAGVGIWGYLLLARRGWTNRLSSNLALAVLAAFVLATLGSAIPRVFTAKRLAVSLVPYGLLVSAWAVRRLQLHRRLRFALVAFSLTLCVVNILLVPKDPWREIVAVIEQKVGPDDTLWVDELIVPAFDYYYHGSSRRLVLWVAHLQELNNTLYVEQSDSTGEELTWIVVTADPYRNLVSYLPYQKPVWSGDWLHVSVRAYAPNSLDTGFPVSGTDLPAWLLAWPSPLDEACRE